MQATFKKEKAGRKVLEKASKEVLDIISRLKRAYVVVEGDHDVNALADFGITAMTYSAAIANVHSLVRQARSEGKEILILFDLDKGGDEKMRKLLLAFESALDGDTSAVKINTELGRHFLKILNVTSVEQIRAPASELTATARGIKPKWYYEENYGGIRSDLIKY